MGGFEKLDWRRDRMDDWNSVFTIKRAHAFIYCSLSTDSSARSFLNRLKIAVKRPRKISSTKGIKSGSARSTIKNNRKIINNRGYRSREINSGIKAPMPFFVSMFDLLLWPKESEVKIVRCRGGMERWKIGRVDDCFF